MALLAFPTADATGNEEGSPPLEFWSVLSPASVGCPPGVRRGEWPFGPGFTAQEEWPALAREEASPWSFLSVFVSPKAGGNGSHSCVRAALSTLGTSLPSVVGNQTPRAPIPGAGPAKPRVAPLCSVSWIMGGILRRAVMGLGPGRGPQQLHTEASVQQPTPRGSPPTFPGCRHLRGTTPGRAGGGRPVSRQ